MALTAGCGGAAVSGNTVDDDERTDRPQVVVTTAILGDIVTDAVGAVADVEVVMPAGADPHDFALSARQAEAMERADLVVTNGRGLEAAMADVIDSVSTGTEVFVAGEHVPASDDPHIWMDPTNVIGIVVALEAELAPLVHDEDALSVAVEMYVAELEVLDADIGRILEAVPDDQRVMVTNHDSFGAFANRYGLLIVGTVIPSTTTSAEPSAAGLEALAAAVRDAGVHAVFAESTQPTRLADALANEVGEIDGRPVVVVELYSGGIGEPGSGADSYLSMLRLDAELIAGALRP